MGYKFIQKTGTRAGKAYNVKRGESGRLVRVYENGQTALAGSPGPSAIGQVQQQTTSPTSVRKPDAIATAKDPPMSKHGPLTAKQRDNLKPSQFALPGGRYPINDANHARNALSRVSQYGTPEQIAQVRSKVKKKYPGMGTNERRKALTNYMRRHG